MTQKTWLFPYKTPSVQIPFLLPLAARTQQNLSAFQAIVKKKPKIAIKQLMKRAALKAATVQLFSKTTVLILQNNVTIYKKLPLSLQTTGTWRALTGFPLLYQSHISVCRTKAPFKTSPLSALAERAFKIKQ